MHHSPESGWASDQGRVSFVVAAAAADMGAVGGEAGSQPPALAAEGSLASGAAFPAAGNPRPSSDRGGRPWRGAAPPSHPGSPLAAAAGLPSEEACPFGEGVPHPFVEEHPSGVVHPFEGVHYSFEGAYHPFEGVHRPCGRGAHPFEGDKVHPRMTLQEASVPHPLDGRRSRLRKAAEACRDALVKAGHLVVHPFVAELHPFEEVHHPFEKVHHPFEGEHLPFEGVVHRPDSMVAVYCLREAVEN